MTDIENGLLFECIVSLDVRKTFERCEERPMVRQFW